MSKRVLGIAGFGFLLALYAIVLAAVATVLPLLGLGAILAWMIARRPLLHQGRLEHDIDVFRKCCSEYLGKALELLMRPLRDCSR